MLSWKFIVMINFVTCVGSFRDQFLSRYPVDLESKCFEILKRCDALFPKWGDQKITCVDQCWVIANAIKEPPAGISKNIRIIDTAPSKQKYKLLTKQGRSALKRRHVPQKMMAPWIRLISKLTRFLTQTSKKYAKATEDASDMEDKIHQLYTNDGQKIWDGDMVLATDQIEKLFKRGRKAREPVQYRWPKGKIPFVISDSSLQDRKAIIEALKHWMEHTCIVFQELSQSPENMNHVIFKRENGCYSQVGKDQRPKGQVISVGDGCVQMGTIAHEIGHALGFYHEHCRSDRDQHIRLNTQNVKDVFRSNFLFKQDISSFGIPYDMNSIMHYAPKEFSMNGRNTILTVDPMKQFNIGQRYQLSFYDKKLANLMYNCSDMCEDKSPCFNEGYMDKYCVCICPPQYTGEYCEKQILQPGPKCGGFIFRDGYIKTPNFPHNHPEDTKCVWWIKAPKLRRVSLFFSTFDMRARNKQPEGCKVDYIEIRGANQYDGDFFCGSELQDKIVVSSTRDMIILFSTKYGNNIGFNGLIKLIPSELYDPAKILNEHKPAIKRYRASQYNNQL